jgi:hypothetical protein
MEHVPTASQHADIFTKALPPIKHIFHRTYIGSYEKPVVSPQSTHPGLGRQLVAEVKILARTRVDTNV